jgi:hypothetical protein
MELQESHLIQYGWELGIDRKGACVEEEYKENGCMCGRGNK